jgi:hypothetical protein
MAELVARDRLARQVTPGGSEGVGEVAEVVFRTRLGYRLHIQTRSVWIVPPTELDVESRGELEGVGSWRLTSEGDETIIRYLWSVQTRRRWMNLVAPLLRPAFKWNHDQVMQSGQAGLTRLLAPQTAADV